MLIIPNFFLVERLYLTLFLVNNGSLIISSYDLLGCLFFQEQSEFELLLY